MERPKCANIKCENDGWINVGGEYYCGECVVRMNNKQKEELRRMMEDGN